REPGDGGEEAASHVGEVPLGGGPPTPNLGIVTGAPDLTERIHVVVDAAILLPRDADRGQLPWQRLEVGVAFHARPRRFPVRGMPEYPRRPVLEIHDGGRAIVAPVLEAEDALGRIVAVLARSTCPVALRRLLRFERRESGARARDAPQVLGPGRPVAGAEEPIRELVPARVRPIGRDL